ncbi:conserved hypothetical protein [Candidatus Sulfopaludibacter sp. SbA3]|nr:conserved hypothetical protein [Candidatus Sulfopaludibacter sp. SbA3]
MSRDSRRIIDSRHWIGDLAIRQLSLASRGLCVDLTALAEQGNPAGFLTLPRALILSLVGITEQDYAAGLAELEAAGVFRRDESGAVFSPGLVKRETNRANGRRGGNPKL